MKAKTYKTLQFELNEAEKEILDKTWEILREVKNGFIINKMEIHKEQMDIFMKLLSEVMQGKEIVE